MIKKVINYLKSNGRKLDELIWAQTWHDTMRGIPWMENVGSISPGRWAVGYNYLYVMTRILNEINPSFVLDLGLGISSTLFSAYFNYISDDSARHIIIEQDKEWENFYKSKHELSTVSEIKIANIVKKEIYGIEYNAYENFANLIEGYKFQVISIDAPWGSAHHSRRDIVDLLPNILAEDFVLVFDDSQREGEAETIEEVMNVLMKKGRKVIKGNYRGTSDVTVIASENYGFLCSL